MDALRPIVDDPDVRRFTRVPASPPPDFAESWVAGYEQGRIDGTREGFAVADAEDGRFLGIAVAFSIDREAQTVELGYIVAPGARGRGVAAAALGRLTEWAFTELGALRIELRISVHNEPSKRVAQRCGYRREGVLRSVYLKDGVREDTELWSRLPSDSSH